MISSFWEVERGMIVRGTVESAVAQRAERRPSPGRHGPYLKRSLPFEYPRPVFGFGAKAPADGVHSDVCGFLLEFGCVAEAVVEVVVLPFYWVVGSDVVFPVRDGFGEARRVWCCYDCVKVVRHEQGEAAEPG